MGNNKKGRVRCDKCGHYSLLQTDKGFVQGCSIWNLVEDGEEYFNDAIASQTDGKESRLFFKIDTSFLLNKNGDCKYWREQNLEQKNALKKYKRFYWIRMITKPIRWLFK